MKGLFSGMTKLSDNKDNEENQDAEQTTEEAEAETTDEETVDIEESATEFHASDNESNTAIEMESPVIPEPIDGPRYSIGIDLGTTHCVLSYIDISDPDADEIVQHVLDIPQLFY